MRKTIQNGHTSLHTQYDGIGIDGFAFAYTIDPKALEDQAYAWENTVKNAPQSYPTQRQQQYWTMLPVRRVALTANDFALGAAKLSSNPAWRQAHSGWKRGDCEPMSGPGTDTGISFPESDRHFSAGRSYENAGNWTQAIGEYRSAVRFNPANAMAFDRLGVALTKNAQPQEATQQVRKAICLDNSNRDFHGDLAAAYSANGNAAGAIIEYQIALWFNPGNAQFHRDQLARPTYLHDGQRLAILLSNSGPGGRRFKSFSRPVFSST
jgi:tetratricopeptide (TPR) repeat protein